MDANDVMPENAACCERCGEELAFVEDEDRLCEDCQAEFDSMDLEDQFEVAFADPGGRSALRAATPNNPRNLPCPNCGRENVLTPADVACGYQCDACADVAERGW